MKQKYGMPILLLTSLLGLSEIKSAQAKTDNITIQCTDGTIEKPKSGIMHFHTLKGYLETLELIRKFNT